MLCIASGITFGVFWFLTNMNGFCIFGEWICISCMTLQALVMGFYQLSRLYHCFSNDKIHSNKGYPRSLFIVMYTLGLILGLVGIIKNSFTSARDDFRAKCGVNIGDLNYYYKQYNMNIFNIDGQVLKNIISVSWFGWDVSTLFLYIFKMMSFKRYRGTQPEIYRRITSILFKIFILTIFYEITSAVSIVLILSDRLFIFEQFGRLLYSVSFSFAMFLMMDYNKEQYKVFLSSILYVKCNVLCCCWRKIVVDQIDELTEDTKILEVDDGDSKQKEMSEITATETTPCPMKPHATSNSEISIDIASDEAVE